MNKLNKLSKGNKAIAIEILNKSSDGGWSDLYELKNNTNATPGDNITVVDGKKIRWAN